MQMGKFEYGAQPAAMPDGLTLDNGAIVLAVHLDLTTYEIKCPYCGTPLNLTRIERRTDGGDSELSSASMTSTVIDPAVCPQCGRVVVYGED